MTEKEKELIEVLEKSGMIQKILDLAPSLGVADWYIGAGAVAQTVWNDRSGFELTNGIKDIDLGYFDPDTSKEKQETFIKKGAELFRDIPIPVDIVNQARVHLWYKDEQGKEIRPYGSTEEAIDEWPTTATAVAVAKTPEGQYKIYAPFGLDDVLGMVVRPNKRKITEDIYLGKTERWKAVWPDLTIVPW